MFFCLFINVFDKILIRGEEAMENIKVAFMFGAGAEGTKNFDLPLGGAFQTNTLITNKDKEKEKRH